MGIKETAPKVTGLIVQRNPAGAIKRD